MIKCIKVLRLGYNIERLKLANILHLTDTMTQLLLDNHLLDRIVCLFTEMRVIDSRDGTVHSLLSHRYTERVLLNYHSPTIPDNEYALQQFQQHCFVIMNAVDFFIPSHIDMEKIIQPLSNLEHLTKLSIGGKYYTNLSTVNLCRLFTILCTKLTRIRLSQLDIQMDNILASIVNCTGLVKLQLSDMVWRDLGPIFVELAKMKNLSNLKVTGKYNYFENTSALPYQSFVYFLNNNKSCKKLYVHQINFTHLDQHQETLTLSNNITEIVSLYKSNARSFNIFTKHCTFHHMLALKRLKLKVTNSTMSAIMALFDNYRQQFQPTTRIQISMLDEGTFNLVQENLDVFWPRFFDLFQIPINITTMKVHVNSQWMSDITRLFQAHIPTLTKVQIMSIGNRVMVTNQFIDSICDNMSVTHLDLINICNIFSPWNYKLFTSILQRNNRILSLKFQKIPLFSDPNSFDNIKHEFEYIVKSNSTLIHLDLSNSFYNLSDPPDNLIYLFKNF
ncbi:hypothetical protein DLAC_10216 [Tieghemostelium lacteum]|uniref:Uncharacterized protein n=1 Tax=Tieghemostelium lacteum TaxID=361077 RepID=A0A151Z4W2_TIELA|nr:hypothetical protein DLAC_10216 [Tieghemostelium lacteum]|eukprot:KYQ89000.1 hypothetical protein DLAC_10216 [Tieghemostelium lacteum]